MSIVKTGTPFVGYAQLKNGTLGPVAFTLYTVLTGNTPYALQAAAAATGGFTTGTEGTPQAERLIITNISISTNDTNIDLVTLDAGASAASLLSRYISNLVAYNEHFEAGFLKCQSGVVPRVSASAVAPGCTIECTIHGFITRS